jgi:hypothetical protein
MGTLASRLLRLATLVAFIGIGCHACSSQQASRKETAKMIVDPATFVRIPLNTMKESPCSPQVDEDFRGSVIAAPDSIDLAGPWHEAVGINKPRPVLPVCGTIQYTAATDARFLSTMDQILLVAVDARTHVSYVSNLEDKGGESDPRMFTRPTPEQLEEWKNRVYTSFFNANAFYYLEDLPAAPARYHIFAVVGDIVSNMKTVEVTARKIAPGETLFGKAARAPAVTASFRGVSITSRLPRWPGAGVPVWIDGVVQLDAKDADALGVTPIQRALVATVSSGFVYRSWNPAGEQALFADDQERVGTTVRAAFSFELSKAFGPSRDEGVYVLVSVGPFISNVVFIPSSLANPLPKGG